MISHIVREALIANWRQVNALCNAVIGEKITILNQDDPGDSQISAHDIAGTIEPTKFVVHLQGAISSIAFFDRRTLLEFYTDLAVARVGGVAEEVMEELLAALGKEV